MYKITVYTYESFALCLKLQYSQSIASQDNRLTQLGGCLSSKINIRIEDQDSLKSLTLYQYE